MKQLFRSLFQIFQSISMLIKYAWPFRDYQLVKVVNNIIEKENRKISILDLGCGTGITALRIITKSNLRYGNIYLVGLDVDERKLRIAKFIENDVVLGDASNPPFRSKAFDLIFMIEVLDHLPKNHGKLLLKELNGIARRGILITYPHGTIPSLRVEPCIWDRHSSNWYPHEFSVRGYHVIGVVPKKLAWFFMRFTTRPFLILQLLIPLLNLIRLPPAISWQLIAYKITKSHEHQGNMACNSKS